MNNLLNKVGLVIVIIMIIFTIIVSQDEHHLEICDKEHCAICNMIYIARYIINFFLLFAIVIKIKLLIHIFLSRIYKERSFLVKLTLVFQKVELNE